MNKAGKVSEALAGLLQKAAKQVGAMMHGANEHGSKEEKVPDFTRVLSRFGPARDGRSAGARGVEQEKGSPVAAGFLWHPVKLSSEAEDSAADPSIGQPQPAVKPQECAVEPLSSLALMLTMQAKTAVTEAPEDYANPQPEPWSAVEKNADLPLFFGKKIIESSRFSGGAQPSAQAAARHLPSFLLTRAEAQINVQSFETHIEPARQPLPLIDAAGVVPKENREVGKLVEALPYISLSPNRAEASSPGSPAPMPSALPIPPVQQIAERIAAELVPSSESRRPQSASWQDVPNYSSNVVKVLHIKLEPAELGALTVHISLKQDVLHLHLEVARHETARLIKSDQEALTNLLQSAGYRMDGMVVQTADADKSAASGLQGGQAFGPFSGQPQSGGAQPESQTGTRPQTAREHNPPPQTPDENPHDQPITHSRSGSLYV